MSRKPKISKVTTILAGTAITCVFSAVQAVSQQGGGSAGSGTNAKEARFEGRVERSSKEQSSLTIRKNGGNVEMSCVYDSDTKWVSQYHADKKVNDIDASQVKDGDYVICKGTAEKGGVIHATIISKRLSHSQ
jgi:hypothetical protein